MLCIVWWICELSRYHTFISIGITYVLHFYNQRFFFTIYMYSCVHWCAYFKREQRSLSHRTFHCSERNEGKISCRAIKYDWERSHNTRLRVWKRARLYSRSLTISNTKTHFLSEREAKTSERTWKSRMLDSRRLCSFNIIFCLIHFIFSEKEHSNSLQAHLQSLKFDKIVV
jgi:hypothetical protein